jgi:hypothetical protein
MRDTPSDKRPPMTAASRRGVWRAAYVALRARRQVLERKAPPEVLPGMGWSLLPRS